MLLSESILIVDDDPSRWPVWSKALKRQGFVIEHADDSNEARALFGSNNFGLALVSLGKHARDNGMSLLDWIVENYPSTDVIVITTYTTINISLEALKKGAYDYLVTPANIVEVVTRVDRCMKERLECAERLEVIEEIEAKLNLLRTQFLPAVEDRSEHDDILETRSIIVDRRKRLVVRHGEPVQLSPTEFDILDYLASNDDHVVSASELIRAVQGYDIDELDARPVVRVYVRRLRQKIEIKPSSPEHILTVRSRGYRFAG